MRAYVVDLLSLRHLLLSILLFAHPSRPESDHKYLFPRLPPRTFKWSRDESFSLKILPDHGFKLSFSRSRARCFEPPTFSSQSVDVHGAPLLLIRHYIVKAAIGTAFLWVPIQGFFTPLLFRPFSDPFSEGPLPLPRDHHSVAASRTHRVCSARGSCKGKEGLPYYFLPPPSRVRSL